MGEQVSHDGARGKNMLLGVEALGGSASSWTHLPMADDPSDRRVDIDLRCNAFLCTKQLLDESPFL